MVVRGVNVEQSVGYQLTVCWLIALMQLKQDVDSCCSDEISLCCSSNLKRKQKEH